VTAEDAAKTSPVEEKSGAIAVSKERPHRVEAEAVEIIDSVVDQPAEQQEEEQHGTL
jgi:hypothetical protein